MVYRVILLSNGEYKKTLHRCKTSDTAFINYHKFREESDKVYFPKKFINYKGIKPVKYEICITKTTEEGDTFRVLRDEYGKLYTEKPIGDWTIITSEAYNTEEDFWVYGFNSRSCNRPTIKEVVKRLMVNAHSTKMVKQIIVAHNKLVIYNEDQFDMVICKNLDDAQRLHHSLAKIAKKQKLKSLMFMGTATKATIGRIYDLIHDETGWPYVKIRRTSTRP